MKISLDDLGLIKCRCGAIYHLETMKDWQYNMRMIRQEVHCKLCDNRIWVEE